MQPGAAMEELGSLAPEGVDAETWELYAAGEISRAAGNPSGAMSYLQAALARDPESPVAQSAWFFLTLAGEPRISSLRDLVARWPELERPRFYLGLSLATEYRYEEAARLLRACVDDIPQDLQAWFYLGHSMRRMGDKKGAGGAARQVRELARSFTWRRSAAQQLLQSGFYAEAFKTSFEAAREFRSLRARLLPWTLLIQVNAFVADSLVAGAWALTAIFIFNGDGFVVPLVIAVLLSAWRLLATYSSGARHLTQSSRQLKRWRRGRAGGVPYQK
jgi:tetratricopeptide (TPR) repeat protein